MEISVTYSTLSTAILLPIKVLKILCMFQIKEVKVLFKILLKVSKHKTDYIGPATVAFPRDVWGYMLSYLHALRSMEGYHDRTQRKTTVFVKFPDGLDNPPKPLSTSGVSYALKKLWGLAHKGKPFSATRLRKAIVTHVRDQQPLARDSLAKHMCHAPSTADRYYLLQQTRKMALPMSSLITHTMTRPAEPAQEEIPSTSQLPSTSQMIIEEIPNTSEEEMIPGTPPARIHLEVANSDEVPDTPPLRSQCAEIPEEVEEILIPGIPPWRRLSSEIPSDVRIFLL